MDSPLPRNSGLWPRMALRHCERNRTLAENALNELGKCYIFINGSLINDDGKLTICKHSKAIDFEKQDNSHTFLFCFYGKPMRSKKVSNLMVIRL